MSEWSDRKQAQLDRAMGRGIPGLQTSQTSTTYRLRYSDGDLEDVAIVGRVEVAINNAFTGEKIVTASAVDLDDAQVDAVLGCWTAGITAELPFVVRE